MKIIIKTFLIILITIQFSCRSGNQTKEKENEVAIVPATV